MGKEEKGLEPANSKAKGRVDLLEDVSPKDVETIAKRMAKPFREVFDDNTLRIRRNLLVVACVALFYKLKLGSIDPTSAKIIGLQFNNIQPDALDFLLISLIGYFLIHFIWCAVEDLQIWRFRLTGLTASIGSGGAFAGGVDTTSHANQKQLTLSDWWSHNVDVLKLIDSKFELDQQEEALRRSGFSVVNGDRIRESINQINTSAKQLGRNSNHVRIALTRYEKNLKMLTISQNLRWAVVEFGLPIVIGLAALYFLFF